MKNYSKKKATRKVKDGMTMSPLSVNVDKIKVQIHMHSVTKLRQSCMGKKIHAAHNILFALSGEGHAPSIVPKGSV